MASRRRYLDDHDDQISYCGSISCETFSSRRRRNTCNLRQHSIDSIAQKLRCSSFDDGSRIPEADLAKKRRNTFFHNYRFVVVMFSGFSVGSMLLLRYNITVAILNMVNQTALYLHEHPNRTVDDFIEEGYEITDGEFDWDNEIQHMIMSWYMIAYTIPQVLATKVGLIIGSRLTIMISLLIICISTLLTPTAAYWGWEYVLALRLINGIGSSGIIPMMLNLVENWMPYNEISIGLTCAQLITATLTASNPLIAGYLSSIHWSYAFYIPGAATVIFTLIWFLMISDRPDDSWIISQKELDLICGCSSSKSITDHSQHQATQASDCSPEDECKGVKTTTTTTTQQANNSDKSQLRPDDRSGAKVTAMDIFKVPSFYAYLVLWSFFCSSFSGFNFILPTYLRQFLKIDVSQNGFYCFLIQTGSLLSVTWPHGFLKILEQKLNLSRRMSVRLTYAIICFMVGSTWIYVGVFHENQLMTLFLNRSFQGSNDIVVTGTLMSNYASVGLSSMAFSMVNTIGNLSVVFTSTFIGWLLDATGQSREGWSWIYCALGFSQVLMFIIFTTLIRPGPIDFSRSSNNDNNKSDPARTNSDDEDSYHIEVICKKDSPGSALNNFDKLKEADINIDKEANI